MTTTGMQRANFWGGVITVLTILFALIWAFPLYWGVISSLKPEDEVVRPYIELWPEKANPGGWLLRPGVPGRVVV